MNLRNFNACKQNALLLDCCGLNDGAGTTLNERNRYRRTNTSRFFLVYIKKKEKKLT